MILLYVCYAKYIRKDHVVKLGGYGFLLVMTGSMEPTIEKDELIIIKEKKVYQVGDIATYVDVYGNLITHRIEYLDERDFITKGDGNQIADESTNVNNIQGKVIYHSKPLGIFILYYLRLVIAVYIVLWFILYVAKILRKEEKHEEKQEGFCDYHH